MEHETLNFDLCVSRAIAMEQELFGGESSASAEEEDSSEESSGEGENNEGIEVGFETLARMSII